VALKRIFLFGFSALASLSIDAAVLLQLYERTGNLLFSVLAARAISSCVNFSINRRLVFAGAGNGAAQSASRYFGLVAVMAVANVAVLHSLYNLVGVPLPVAKLMTEATLFSVSYQVQRRVVFAGARRPAALAEVAEVQVAEV
jgi:putative flippase GtrA